MRMGAMLHDQINALPSQVRVNIDLYGQIFTSYAMMSNSIDPRRILSLRDLLIEVGAARINLQNNNLIVFEGTLRELIVVLLADEAERLDQSVRADQAESDLASARAELGESKELIRKLQRELEERL